jgi:hypothetical protein
MNDATMSTSPWLVIIALSLGGFLLLLMCTRPL